MAHRLLVVVGTRPEAIKMAPLLSALRAYGDDVETRTALTGQHTSLVDQALEVFGIEPEYDLGIMKEGQSLYDVLHAALDGLRDVVRDFRPDVLLVQGDTATVFAGALVGFFEGVRIGHVEAGLRTGDRRAPFPEEAFRRLTDVLADYYFVPTLRAEAALRAEGVPAERVFVTGNTVVDALLGVAAREHEVRCEPLRSALGDPAARLVLLTAHRRESFGAPLREIFRAVRALADQRDDVRVVYPVHPNPNVSEPAHELLSGHPRIALVEPLDYLDLVAALQGASLILTDSGGIQEEAPTFGTPVLVLRDVTERPEGVEAGVAEVVGSDCERIVERSLAALAGGRAGGAAGGAAEGTRAAGQADEGHQGSAGDRGADRAAGGRLRPAPNPYGDGRAGERIADILVSDLQGRPRRTRDWVP